MQGLRSQALLDAHAESPSHKSEPDSRAPILVAVDFSPESEAALAWACDYADGIGAPIEILHVVHDPSNSPGTYLPDDGDPLEPMTDVAKRRLAKLVDRTGRDNPCLRSLEISKQTCRPGLPASTILEVARIVRARHLVLGTHRRSSFARLLKGSTTRRIIGKADFPVTIVKTDRP